MTLKSLRKVLNDSKYRVVSSYLIEDDEAPEVIEVDYLGKSEEFQAAMQRILYLEEIGARVRYVYRNYIAGVIEIRVTYGPVPVAVKHG